MLDMLAIAVPLIFALGCVALLVLLGRTAIQVHLAAEQNAEMRKELARAQILICALNVHMNELRVQLGEKLAEPLVEAVRRHGTSDPMSN